MAYSNLAYKYDNLAKIEKDDALARETQKAGRLKLQEQRRMNFFLVCSIILLSLSAYFMISKNVQLHETSDKIKTLERELAMLESNSSQRIFELEQSVDLNVVEQIATTRLNMQRPEKYQIVYLDVKSEDVTEITSKETESVKKQVGSMTEALRKNISGIFDFKTE